MLRVSEITKDGRRYVHDLHDLKLPDGKFAHQVSGPDLYRELIALGIPVDPHHGHYDLSLAFSRWLQDNKPVDKASRSWEQNYG